MSCLGKPGFESVNGRRTKNSEAQTQARVSGLRVRGLGDERGSMRDSIFPFLNLELCKGFTTELQAVSSASGARRST